MSHLRGPLHALVAAVLFGISPPLAKQLIGDINPHLLAGLLYLGSGAELGALIVIRHCRPSTRGVGKRLEGREWIWLGLAILFGGVVAPVLLMVSLAHTAATSASLRLNLEGVLTAVSTLLPTSCWPASSWRSACGCSSPRAASRWKTP